MSDCAVDVIVFVIYWGLFVMIIAWFWKKLPKFIDKM